MKMNCLVSTFSLGLALAFSLQPLPLKGQGSLTPPGAPGPTMKSLDQIEARTPIGSAPFTIGAAGSYYVTTNLTVSSGNGITIAANGVTVDLNGFTIRSTAASATGNGIFLNSGLQDITILNGHIRGGVTNNGSGVYSGSGFSSGIYFFGTAPVNVRVSGVSVSGCWNGGITLDLGNTTVVEGCTVRTVGSAGIMASTIKGCSALDCGYDGLTGDQVIDSRGQSTSNGSGVNATTAQNCSGYSSDGYGVTGNLTVNCYGSSSAGKGINANNAVNCYGHSVTGDGVAAYLIQNCYGDSSSGWGINAMGGVAQNCYGYSSSGYGVRAYTAQSCYGASSSGYGVYCSHTAIACYADSAGPRALYAENAAFCTAYCFGGRAIQAVVANGCYATSGTNLITYKYNMP